MKSVWRTLLVAGVLIAGAAGYAVSTARRSARPVGFQVERVFVGQERPMSIGIWYPTSSTPRPATLLGSTLMSVAPDGPVQGHGLPLVVLSHGNGGSLASHLDLAMDLAAAGFVVAAPTHPGDNFADQGAAGSERLYSERARQVRATLDYVLGAWRGHGQVDANRVGAFGFSAGAFTVLTLIGGRPDMAAIATHCAASPEFICKVLQQAGSALLRPDGKAAAFAADHRIKAAIVAAPGLGFTFGHGGLGDVRVPIQLWVGDRDDRVPFATNGGIIRQGLATQVEFHEAKGAGHLSFLSPCGMLGPPAMCSDAGGFDREAFHALMNAAQVRFLVSHLRPRPR